MGQETIRVEMGGRVAELPRGATPAEAAAAMDGEAGDAVAARVDGVLVDLGRPLDGDARVELVDADSAEGIAVLRHSAAHLLAAAVRRLRPDARIGFGPATDQGFHYDFGVDRPFTPDELREIEGEMAELAARDEPFARRDLSRDEARALFAADPLKRERLDEIPAGEAISAYVNGDFIDLCRGPHVPRTALLRHVRLLGAAGAYWRGDERREVLQRITGVAFPSAEALEAHLARAEEARRRDHRVLGEALDLYSTDPRVGAGLILWHPKGAAIRAEVERFERELIHRHGYDFVSTPHLMGEALFQMSGHVDSFAEGMWPAVEMDGRRYHPKPMNCPGHIAIYQSRPRSHRDLPLRWAEFGAVYRNERSGVLHGMLRVRGFTQDDAHVFCTPAQLPDEIGRALDLVDEALAPFGYAYSVDLATRPEKAVGDAARWAEAEALLASVLRARGMAYGVDEGGGAFYGPKLDFKLVDAIGRAWQGPTVQLDFNLPERFGMEYTGPDNRPHRPVMVHRVLLGSMERFVGGLIEHYGGAFPVWLAPVQCAVLPVREEQEDAARAVADEMRAAGLRPELYRAGQTLSARIRHAEMMKVPYMAVVGAREADAGAVSVRRRGGSGRAEVVSRAAFIARVRDEAASRAPWDADGGG